jgi:hypothetical protein
MGKIIAVLLVLLCGVALAQPKMYQETNIQKLETYVRYNGGDYFLLGGYLWNGMEGFFLKELEQKKKVRILATATTAANFQKLAKAGAEVRYGSGQANLGAMLLLPKQVLAVRNKAVLIIEGLETATPILNNMNLLWEKANRYQPK